ncbi:uncharacterized [Lates japonicus]
MLLAFELQPLFGFALKPGQRKCEQRKRQRRQQQRRRRWRREQQQQQQQQQRWWCSSNAKVLRIAAAYTHCEPAAASLTLITTEGDITISEGAAGGTITRQQCKSHPGST